MCSSRQTEVLALLFLGVSTCLDHSGDKKVFLHADVHVELHPPCKIAPDFFPVAKERKSACEYKLLKERRCHDVVHFIVMLLNGVGL